MIDSSDLIRAYHEAKDGLEHCYSPIAIENVGVTTINGIRYKAELTLVQDLSSKGAGSAIREIEMKLVGGLGDMVKNGQEKRQKVKVKSEKAESRRLKALLKSFNKQNDVPLSFRAAAHSTITGSVQFKSKDQK